MTIPPPPSRPALRRPSRRLKFAPFTYLNERHGLVPWFYVFGHALHYFATGMASVFQSDLFWKYVGYTGLLVQVAASASLISLLGFRLRFAWLYMTLLSYLAWLALLGMLSANSISYMGVDLLAFGLFLGFAPGGSSLVLERLARFYSVALIPGLLMSLVVLSRIQPGNIMARFVTEDSLDAFAIRALCIPASFLLLVCERQDRITVLVTCSALVVMCIYGWFTATRTELLIPFLTLLFATITGRPIRAQAKCFLLVLAAASLAGSLIFGADRLADAADGAWARFTGQTEFSGGRDLEAEAFFRATSPADWIIGRGLGGAYWGFFAISNPHGLNMAHFGHLHLILKGGLILLFLVSITILLASFVGFASRRTPSAGAAGFIALFVFINSGHTSFLANNTMAFFGLALGQALLPRQGLHERTRRRRNPWNLISSRDPTSDHAPGL